MSIIAHVVVDTGVEDDLEHPVTLFRNGLFLRLPVAGELIDTHCGRTTEADCTEPGIVVTGVRHDIDSGKAIVEARAVDADELVLLDWLCLDGWQAAPAQLEFLKARQYGAEAKP